jgi:hypothetical protein
MDLVDLNELRLCRPPCSFQILLKPRVLPHLLIQKGELAAPRQLLRYLLCQNESPKTGELSTS